MIGKRRKERLGRKDLEVVERRNDSFNHSTTHSTHLQLHQPSFVVVLFDW